MKNSSETQKLIVPIFLTVFIDLLGATLVIPILAPLFLDLVNGISPVDTSTMSQAEIGSILKTRTFLFGLLIASFPLAQFFGAPILGAWADRVGRKRVLLISLIGTLIGYVLFAIGVHLHLVWLLFVARILDGFTGGNISIAFSAMSDISTPETKTKNFGLIGMAFGLGFIIGPYLGGKLSDPSIISWFNFETPFWFAAGLCAINIIFLIFLFKETLQVKTDKNINALKGFQNLSRAIKQPNLRTIFTVVFLLIFGFSIFTQFLQVYLIQKFSFNQSKIGDFFGFIGICIAFTQGFLTRRLSGKIQPNKAVQIFGLGLSIALAIVLLPQNPTLLYMVSPLIAINQGLLSPNLQTIVSNSGTMHEQGEIMGINQSVQSLGQAIPPIVAGIVVSINMYLPIILASFFTFLAWATFTFIYQPKHTK